MADETMTTDTLHLGDSDCRRIALELKHMMGQQAVPAQPIQHSSPQPIPWGAIIASVASVIVIVGAIVTATIVLREPQNDIQSLDQKVGVLQTRVETNSAQYAQVSQSLSDIKLSMAQLTAALEQSNAVAEQRLKTMEAQIAQASNGQN